MDADEKGDQNLQSLDRRVPSGDEKANYINHRLGTQALNTPPKAG